MSVFCKCTKQSDFEEFKIKQLFYHLGPFPHILFPLPIIKLAINKSDVLSNTKSGPSKPCVASCDFSFCKICLLIFLISEVQRPSQYLNSLRTTLHRHRTCLPHSITLSTNQDLSLFKPTSPPTYTSNHQEVQYCHSSTFVVHLLNCHNFLNWNFIFSCYLYI